MVFGFVGLQPILAKAQPKNDEMKMKIYLKMDKRNEKQLDSNTTCFEN